MLRFDERVHLPKNRENTIAFLVNGEPIGTVETLAPGAKTVDIPIPSVDYDSVIDALGYVPQEVLVSGSNIKTINNTSLLGSGNIDIQGGGSSYTAGNGIDITNDVISIDNTVALKSDIPTITVDQVYDATSANAQSGIAIAGAGFLTGINSTDVTNALGYTPVDKAGDTMSGTLQMSSSVSPQIIIKDTSQVAGTTPTGTEQAMAIQFKDSNDLLLGYVQNVYGTDGSRVSMLNSRNADGTARTGIIVGYNASGDAYCTFPHTTCVDGQWVYKNTSLGSGVTWNASSHKNAKSYSLSSYLPNDGQKYEVIVRAQGTTTSTSGKLIAISIYSDILTAPIYVCRCRTRSSSTVNCSGNIVIPVGTGRKIYVAGVGSEASADGTYDIVCMGYRRIGTNS